MTVDTTASLDARDRRIAAPGYYLVVLLVSFSGLLLEISYTRVISFKLFYYYTYLVIGLALLGIGSGGVLVAVSNRLRRAATDTVLTWSLLLGAAAVAVGYVVEARASLDTFAIWHYGDAASLKNTALLLAICLALFAPFVAVGVVVSTIYGRKPERVGRFYCADLAGAGLACAVVVALIGSVGPPATIFLAGAILAAAGLWAAGRRRSRLVPFGALAVATLTAVVVTPSMLPGQRLEASKYHLVGKSLYSAWSPVFRVDVRDRGNRRVLYHDGLLGSAIYRWDGKESSLERFHFGRDTRSFPFAVLGGPAANELIIGAAGGAEVLASLRFHARRINAVELNPVTYRLVTDKYAGYDGHLAQHRDVHYMKGDGRSYLDRSGRSYDLIWYPAPDSYAATNAATAGAYVLSESYLYTSDAIKESLRHLRPGGIVVTQFGELDYRHKPNRTVRYVATARHALAELGIGRPAGHILVATTPSTLGAGGNSASTIVVKRTAFTPAEISRFDAALKSTGSTRRYPPSHGAGDDPTQEVIRRSGSGLAAFFHSYPYDVRPISDDRPFFWHFRRFTNVVRRITTPLQTSDREDTVGERVLLLLLAVSVLLAAVFLLLPFIVIRDRWTRLPRKGRSAVYFTALGAGFMFFEITLIQRLVLFLGYPTYSLTVTLASLLIFVGVGALLSARLRSRGRRVLPGLLLAIAGLTAFYAFGLSPLTDSLLGLPLAARVLVAFVVLAPLGVCLGMFMPLGLGVVAGLSDYPREYVAWGWAVNGFAAVIGSTLTTILAMQFGFQLVLLLALVSYLVALAALYALLPKTRAAAAT